MHSSVSFEIKRIFARQIVINVTKFLCSSRDSAEDQCTSIFMDEVNAFFNFLDMHILTLSIYVYILILLSRC